MNQIGEVDEVIIIFDGDVYCITDAETGETLLEVAQITWAARTQRMHDKVSAKKSS